MGEKKNAAFVTSPGQTHLRTCADNLQAMALGGCAASSRGNVCALSLAKRVARWESVDLSESVDLWQSVDLWK